MPLIIWFLLKFWLQNIPTVIDSNKNHVSFGNLILRWIVIGAIGYFKNLLLFGTEDACFREEETEINYGFVHTATFCDWQSHVNML